MKDITIEFTKDIFSIMVNDMRWSFMQPLTLSENDPCLQEIAERMKIDVKDIVETIQSFFKYFPGAKA